MADDASAPNAPAVHAGADGPARDERPPTGGRPRVRAGAAGRVAEPAAGSAATSPAEALPPGFTRREAQVNGTTLSYLIGGEGPPLVLLHGWPQTALAWRHVLEPLARQGFLVVAPDLRGLGASARARSGYDKDTQADDIHGLLTTLGAGRGVRVVGHDIGGMVAFSYARRYPGTVQRLVLAELLVPGLGLEQAMDVASGGRWHFGLFMAREVPELLFAGHEHEFFSWWFAHLAGTGDAVDAAAVAAVVRSYSGAESLRCGFEHYRTLLADGQVNRVWYENGGRLTMPVLAVGGERGAGGGLADALRPAATDVTAAVVPDVGHFVAEEDPERFLRILVPFLSGTGTPGPRGPRCGPVPDARPPRTAADRPGAGTSQPEGEDP